MEYASNEILHMEHEFEKGNTGHSPYMKSGIWDHENYPILEYGEREIMKLGTLTWNKVILKFEVGNLHLPLGSPIFFLVLFHIFPDTTLFSFTSTVTLSSNCIVWILNRYMISYSFYFIYQRVIMFKGANIISWFI